MALVKSPEEIKILRAGGELLSRALQAATAAVKPGVAIFALDKIAEDAIRAGGGTPSFKGFKNSPGDTPFPSALCVSLNDEVVHGLGNRQTVLRDGDIVGLDLGCWYQGLCTDMSVTVPVGHISKNAKRLVASTRAALLSGIAAAKAGVRLGEVSTAIEAAAQSAGLGVIRDLTGHGVGHAVHEAPSVPNFSGSPEDKVLLRDGMVLALEPMFTLGDWRVDTADDGWAVKTRDGSLSAHFEATIVIGKTAPEILTPLF